MALFLFSLLGFPPLAGFAGKFQVFAAVYDAGRKAAAAGRPDLGVAFYTLLGVGAVNTAISAYYYLRVVRTMTLEGESNSPFTGGPSGAASGFLVLLSALLIALGIVWNPLTAATDRAAKTFEPLTPAGPRIPGLDAGPPKLPPTGAGAPKGKEPGPAPNPKQKQKGQKK
jgi:NADH-quinone oxidoreductase subunit N